jgi:signal transduction histidine kinase
VANFKARARTLDMLGRQQIAGIPTAINELFKNAHDAYADWVEVDYYRSDGLFILRDDGMGMTREDFENRWLVLGTESKLNSSAGLRPPPVNPSKPRRPIMGEKGIGRLAISVIGPQVLVLTRAERQDGLKNLVAAFIHWGLFECPGIDLDQIEIPIVEFPGGSIPNRAEVKQLVDSVRKNLASLSQLISPEQQSRINRDLNKFDVDPVEIYGFLEGPKLDKEGHGTHFIILPADETIPDSIDSTSSGTSRLIKTLIGFANTMTPNHRPPAIQTKFKYYRSDDYSEDLIDSLSFFTPEDFDKVDHHISGFFDGYGQFRGQVKIFRQEPVEYLLPWKRSQGKLTECGPFRIEFGVFQGEAAESLLPLEEHGKLYSRVAQIGGLYIYRDGIRVLPYGDNTYDFLDIERRRSQNAGYHYFSYRRMFGAIEIDHKNNSALLEKAGREGFRENKAYFQFKDILINLFSQLAADFFRSGGVLSDTYFEIKDENARVEAVRKKLDKRDAERRKKLAAELSDVLAKVESGELQEHISDIVTQAEERLSLLDDIEAPEQAAIVFNEAEEFARQKIEDVRKSLKVVKPRELGLNTRLKREWTLYLETVDKIERDIITPIQVELEKKLEEAVQASNLDMERRTRVVNALENTIQELRKRTGSEIRETRDMIDQLVKHATRTFRETNQLLETLFRTILAEVNSTNLNNFDDASIVNFRSSLESRLVNAAEERWELLQDLRSQVEQHLFSENTNNKTVTQSELIASRQEEILALKDRVEQDLELSQLGMAIEIINHEFDSSIKAIRNNIRRLKAWAELNPQLLSLYNDIRTSFDHLDGYLTLFTPLHKRLYRKPVEFSGADIRKFLNDLFNSRFQRHEVKLLATPAFLNLKLFGFPSTFYPVFVNLVDNAVFWLSTQNNTRIIQLDAEGKTILISNSGPSISERDRAEIFEWGYSKKPGGRGLGLYISREVLAKEGYTISVDEAKPGKMTTFRIEPEKQAQGSDIDD